MKFFEWKDAYSINNKIIDGQHSKLLEIINNVYVSAYETEDAKRANIEKALVELMDYVGYHFKTEEDLMKQHNYREYSLHRKAHYIFLKRTMKFNKANLDNLDALRHDMLDFLKDWLIRHILSMDKEFGLFLKAEK